VGTFAEQGAECKGKFTRALRSGRSLAVICVRRSPLDTLHPPIGVGGQSALGLIQHDQFVAKGITNARATADCNIEWVLDGRPACVQKCRESFIDVANQNVRLGSNVEVYDEFRVRLGESEAGSFIASPQQTMTQFVPIKGNRRVKIGDPKQMIVELSK
jgi:hypothetical protein